MIRRNQIISTIILITGSLVLTAALIWGNYQYTLKNAGGRDFLVDWFSARSLFIDGVNPYSATAQSNLHEFAANEANIALEEGIRFDVPLYSAFITLPFSLIRDFQLARAVWMALLEVLVAVIVGLSLNLARWHAKPVIFGVILILTGFWFHSLYPILSGSMVIVVALFITGVFLAIRNRHYELAGILLGLTSILPHVMALLALFIVIWSFRQRRAKITGWFFATIILLSATAALIRPRWILDYLGVILQPDVRLNSISEVLQSFLPAAGERLGFILMGLTAIILLYEWFISKKSDFVEFYWTGLLTLTLTPFIGLPSEPTAYFIFLPAIIYAINLWNERWRRAGLALSIASIIVTLAITWIIFFAGIGKPVSANSGLYFAQPIIMVLMLYWVRWWAIQKPNVWFDQFSG